MFTLKTYLQGHRLYLCETPALASGSVAFDRVHFDFDESWDGLPTRVALFWPAEGGDPYGVAVDASGDAKVPYEVLEDTGRIQFGVYGASGSGDDAVRAVSTRICYKIVSGAWSDDMANPGSPTPSLIDQFRQAAEEAMARAQAVTDAAVTNFATEFVATKPYVAGEYVTHDGTLYRFTADHPAGAWTGTDAVKAPVGGELTADSAALAYTRQDLAAWGGINIFNPYALIEKTSLDVATGEPIQSNLYDVTDFIDVQGYTALTFKLFDYEPTPSFAIFFYDNEKGYINRKGNSDNMPGRTVTFATDGTRTTRYIRIRVERQDNSSGSINPYRVMVVLGTQTITDFVPYFSANDWVTRAHTLFLKYGAYTGADANDIDENCRYVCQKGSVSNLPDGNANTLYILETAFTTKNHSTGYQIAYNMTTGARYWRSRFSSAWSSDWLDYSVSAAMLEKLREETIAVKYSAYSGTDADTVADNSRWSCLGKNVDHLPTNSGAYVLETNYTNAAHTSGFQQAYRLADGKRFWRFVHSGTWEPWETWDVDDRGSHPKYIALGDSLMYGAVWSQELADKSKKWYQAAEINRIPTRIAHAVGADDSFVNAAVSGAYFVGSESGDKIINQVKGADLTDVSLITLAGGRNDTTHPLGTSADTAGTATVCGEARAIIEYIQTNAPKCQIVMIQVTPHAETYEEVFATGYHGYWSLNDYKAEMLKICADYCVPFVDWEGCSLFRHWPSFTSAANNYVHPDTEDTYAQMGNYIAGRVAAYYHG